MFRRVFLESRGFCWFLLRRTMRVVCGRVLVIDRSTYPKYAFAHNHLRARPHTCASSSSRRNHQNPLDSVPLFIATESTLQRAVVCRRVLEIGSSTYRRSLWCMGGGWISESRLWPVLGGFAGSYWWYGPRIRRGPGQSSPESRHRCYAPQAHRTPSLPISCEHAGSLAPRSFRDDSEPNPSTQFQSRR